MNSHSWAVLLDAATVLIDSGRALMMPIRENEVYTLELGVTLPGRGYLGLEEMVLVTADGCEWLSTPQTEMPLL